MARLDKTKFADDLRRFKEAMRDVTGDALRKPVSARLGYQDADGVTHLEVPRTRSDMPFKYYFHEAGGNTFQAEAFLQPGALQSYQIRYNTPIRVRKDPLSGEWEIIGLDSRFAAAFFEGVDQDDGVFINYEKMSPGMLTQTLPASMQARVLAAAYRRGNEWRYHETQLTVDWSVSPYSSNVPTDNLKQKYVLVQIDFETGALSYIYGATIPSSIAPIQAYDMNLAAGDNSILPTVTTNHFRCGYLRLVSGVTRLLRNQHIWAIQDYLTYGGSDDDAASDIIDTIITARSDASIIIARSTGHVMSGRLSNLGNYIP